jgi:hypothetical protein
MEDGNDATEGDGMDAPAEIIMPKARLKNYEDALEIHLRKMLMEMEEQLGKMVSELNGSFKLISQLFILALNPKGRGVQVLHPLHRTATARATGRPTSAAIRVHPSGVRSPCHRRESVGLVPRVSGHPPPLRPPPPTNGPPTREGMSPAIGRHQRVHSQRDGTVGLGGVAGEE